VPQYISVETSNGEGECWDGADEDGAYISRLH